MRLVAFIAAKKDILNILSFTELLFFGIVVCSVSDRDPLHARGLVVWSNFTDKMFGGIYTDVLNSSWHKKNWDRLLYKTPFWFRNLKIRNHFGFVI